MITIILCIGAIIVAAFIIGKIIVNVIDDRLSNIKINIPTHITNENQNKEHNKHNNHENQHKENEYINDNILIENFESSKPINACYINHLHKDCNYGLMNFPDPNTLSPIDKRYFKYNYKPNSYSLQDYINWLRLYDDSEEELDYNNMKILQKIRNGEKIAFEHNRIPPPAQQSNDASTYFYRMYNSSAVNVKKPLEQQPNGLVGYNIGLYPNKIPK